MSPHFYNECINNDEIPYELKINGKILDFEFFYQKINTFDSKKIEITFKNCSPSKNILVNHLTDNLLLFFVDFDIPFLYVKLIILEKTKRNILPHGSHFIYCGKR
jgi:hypothetical protein